MDKSRTKVMEVGSAKYDNQLRRPSFISLLWQSYDKSMGMFANNSSFHGWNWYLKVSIPWSKFLVSVALNCICIVVFCQCWIRMFNLYDSLENISASEKEKSFKNHSYPKLTLCHPSFFNRKLLEGTSEV